MNIFACIIEACKTQQKDPVPIEDTQEWLEKTFTATMPDTDVKPPRARSHYTVRNSDLFTAIRHAKMSSLLATASKTFSKPRRYMACRTQRRNGK